MLYLGFLLLAGILQGVMVSLNAQMGNYFSLFGICFFVHGIALVLLLRRAVVCVSGRRDGHRDRRDLQLVYAACRRERVYGALHGGAARLLGAD